MGQGGGGTMRLAIMQPYFFPYLGYFQLIHAVDKFVFLDDVQYIRRGWINRNQILVGGQKYLFTIPMKKGDVSQRICDAQITTDRKWRDKFRTTLEHAYRRSPYFDQAMQLIDKVLSLETSSIAELAKASIRAVITYMGIDRTLVPSSSCYENEHLHGQEKIIDICIRETATVYINPMGGKDIYTPSLFQDSDISLKFLIPSFPEYKQANSTFVPGLSIIDALMFVEPLVLQSMLNEYTLD